MAETPIWEIVPDPNVLLALEPEEVGGIVLEHLNSLPEDVSNFSRHNFGLEHTVRGYPPADRKETIRALTEGWSGWSARG